MTHDEDTEDSADYTKEVSINFVVLLFGTTPLMICIFFWLRSFKKYIGVYLDVRDKYNERAVTIHENYLAFPDFVPDVYYWREQFEKAKIDYDYLLNFLLPMSDDNENKYTQVMPGICKDPPWPGDDTHLLTGLLDDPDYAPVQLHLLTEYVYHNRRRRNRRILDEQHSKNVRRMMKKNSKV